MKVGLIDQDNTSFPNLALMKLSAYHKNKGDKVEFWYPHVKYDRIYASKVFTFSHKNEVIVPEGTICGGVGYDYSTVLPDKIEHICPDYSLYNCNCSYGFTTRGCIRNCKWCIVPKKEGKIRAHAEINEFLRHDSVVLLDNNILAHPHGIKQLEILTKKKVKVDINQGVDARLIDKTIAKLFAKLHWLKPVRLACDTLSMIEPVRKAITLLRWYNVTPKRYFVYVLIQDDKQSALERIMFLKGMNVDAFAQPYRDFSGAKPKQWQKDMARWVNHKAIFNSVTWDEYRKKN